MKKYLLAVLPFLLLPSLVLAAPRLTVSDYLKMINDKLDSLLDNRLGATVVGPQTQESQTQQNFKVIATSTISNTLVPLVDSTGSVGTTTIPLRFAFGAFNDLIAVSSTITGTSSFNGLAIFPKGFLSQASSTVSIGGLTVSSLIDQGNLNVSSTLFVNGVATSTAAGLNVNSLTVAGSSTFIGSPLVVNGLIDQSYLNASGTTFLAGMATTSAGNLTMNGFVSNNSSSTISGGLFLNKGASTNALTMQPGDAIQLSQLDNRGFLKDVSASGLQLYNLTISSAGITIGDAVVTIGWNSGSQAAQFSGNAFNPTGAGTTDDLGTTALRWQNTYLSGGVYSSGTSQFGLTGFPSGFISNASSSIAGNFQVAGLISASGGIAIASSTGAYSVSTSGAIYMQQVAVTVTPDNALCLDTATGLVTQNVGTTCLMI